MVEESDRLVVFAHVPPPEHGQSRMVEAMLQALEQAGARPVHETYIRPVSWK